MHLQFYLFLSKFKIAQNWNFTYLLLTPMLCDSLVTFSIFTVGGYSGYFGYWITCQTLMSTAS